MVVCLTGTLWRPRHAAPRIFLSPPPVKLPLTGVRVILDPGHGGEDPGASVSWGRMHVHEAAFTYRTSVDVADALRAEGATVQFTVHSGLLSSMMQQATVLPQTPIDARMAATGQPLRTRFAHSPRQLWQRASVAGRAWRQAVRSDPLAAHDVFFLSLHYDDFPQENIRGSLVCVDRRAGPTPLFASYLVSGLAARGWLRVTRSSVSGMRLADLGVLDPHYNPVPEKALMEVATLSNYDDFRHAGDPEWRAQIAQIVVRAIAETHAAVTATAAEGRASRLENPAEPYILTRHPSPAPEAARR